MSLLADWMLPAWLLGGPLIGAIVSMLFDGTRDRDVDVTTRGLPAHGGGYTAGTVSAR